MEQSRELTKDVHEKGQTSSSEWPASGVSSEGTVQGAPSTGFSGLQAVCLGLVCELHALMPVLPELHIRLCIFLSAVNANQWRPETFTSSRALFLLALS